MARCAAVVRVHWWNSAWFDICSVLQTLTQIWKLKCKYVTHTHSYAYSTSDRHYREHCAGNMLHVYVCMMLHILIATHTALLTDTIVNIVQAICCMCMYAWCCTYLSYAYSTSDRHYCEQNLQVLRVLLVPRASTAHQVCVHVCMCVWMHVYMNLCVYACK